MSENLGEFERLLGHAALRFWSELPREVQENLFETAVRLDPVIRNRLAILSSRPSSKDGSSAEAN